MVSLPLHLTQRGAQQNGYRVYKGELFVAEIDNAVTRDEYSTFIKENGAKAITFNFGCYAQTNILLEIMKSHRLEKVNGQILGIAVISFSSC